MTAAVPDHFEAYCKADLAFHRAIIAASHKILANVRSEEAEVTGIVGKLTQGAVDAGFTYVTDVKATNGALKAIPLPALYQVRTPVGVS